MKFHRIFVTVGTTEFNDLIKKLSDPELCAILSDILECKELILQIGAGEEIQFDCFKGKTEMFKLKNSIASDIEDADLIISHAGAGTCIDVLSRGKPLIVVVNDTLMSNHQMELAEQLSEDGYLVYSTVIDLPETLKNFDSTKLKAYERGNVDKFVQHLDNLMGFSVE